MPLGPYLARPRVGQRVSSKKEEVLVSASVAGVTLKLKCTLQKIVGWIHF